MRRFSFFWKFALLGWLAFPIFFFHPVFRLLEPDDRPIPVDMRPALETIGERLRDEPDLMRDNWGLLYGPSAPVLERLFVGDEDVAQNLNRALPFLEDGRPARARNFLYRYYNAYSREAIPSARATIDRVPEDVLERILYALTRYNRALALADLAEKNSSPANRGEDLLRRALFDLRRTVFAVERLGAVRDHNGTYWGPGIAAWEGGRLDPDHGDLAIYRVYTNLATLYLRIGNAPRYPFTSQDYLRRERNKYSYGEDDLLSPIMSRLIPLCLERPARTPDLLFRLTMALHNMEAAARGLTGEREEAIFHYTVGLLLNHLADRADTEITLEDAARSLSTARSLAPPDQPVHHLAGKELVLIRLRQDRPAEAQKLIAQLEPGGIEDAIRGPDRERDRCFVDLLQSRFLAEGDLTRALSHFDRRQRQLEDGDDLHDEIVALQLRTYFRGLSRTLASQPHRAGAVLHDLDTNPRLQTNDELAYLLRDETRSLRRNPAVIAQQWFRANPDEHQQIRWAGLAAFLLFLGYHVWMYHSHRQVAKRVLESNYGEELT